MPPEIIGEKSNKEKVMDFQQLANKLRAEHIHCVGKPNYVIELYNVIHKLLSDARYHFTNFKRENPNASKQALHDYIAEKLNQELKSKEPTNCFNQLLESICTYTSPYVTFASSALNCFSSCLENAFFSKPDGEQLPISDVNSTNTLNVLFSNKVKYNYLLSILAKVDYDQLTQYSKTPEGIIDARDAMAHALNTWYFNNNFPIIVDDNGVKEELKITDENILFTNGASGALNKFKQYLDEYYPNRTVLTTQYHYSLYNQYAKGRRLDYVPLNAANSYRLTASALRQTLESATIKDGQAPIAFVFSNPDNPLGHALTEDELKAIANVFREYPETKIVVDEAYAELVFSSKHSSLLSAAPDLKDRIFTIRTGTKSLGVPADRTGIIFGFDEATMEYFNNCQIDACGHSANLIQLAYALTMYFYDETTQNEILQHYQPQVERVVHHLQELKIDFDNEIEAAIYAIADFSEMIGLPLNNDMARKLEKSTLENDIDIAYYLLYKHGIAFSSLSYFHADPTKGLLRITCTDIKPELFQLLEKELQAVREFKQHLKEKAQAEYKKPLPNVNKTKDDFNVNYGTPDYNTLRCNTSQWTFFKPYLPPGISRSTSYQGRPTATNSSKYTTSSPIQLKKKNHNRTLSVHSGYG